MAGRGRSHTTLGFHRDAPGGGAGGREGDKGDKGERGERSFWKDQVLGKGVRAAATSNVGRANEPAASFSYDSRKKNLDPGRKKDLAAPPRAPPPMTKSVVATKPAYKIRQLEREERAKNRYKVPEIVGKIVAEQQIVHDTAAALVKVVVPPIRTSNIRLSLDRRTIAVVVDQRWQKGVISPPIAECVPIK